MGRTQWLDDWERLPKLVVKNVGVQNFFWRKQGANLLFWGCQEAASESAPFEGQRTPKYCHGTQILKAEAVFWL